MTYTTVEATLVMELNVECPWCGHEFDLFETSQNDEGYLYNQVIHDERWKIVPEDRLKTHVDCPNCSADVDVKGVIW